MRLMVQFTTCAALRVGAPSMCAPKLPGHAQRLIHGGRVRTWTYPLSTRRLQVGIESTDRPFDADIELCNGTDTASKIRVYSHNGNSHGFKAIVQTPHSHNTTAVAIRNIGQTELGFRASVSAKEVKAPRAKWFSDKCLIQLDGGALHTYTFPPEVLDVHLSLATSGSPLNGRIELLHQGSHTNKQVIEFFSDDGFERPFLFGVPTSGVASVVRIVNTGAFGVPIVVNCALVATCTP